MSKHTPGPWVAHKAEDLHGYNHFVMTPNGFLGYLPKDSEGCGAQLFSSPDARLIAAAPELLEALQWVDGSPEESAYWIRKVRDAIAKATGE